MLDMERMIVIEITKITGKTAHTSLLATLTNLLVPFEKLKLVLNQSIGYINQSIGSLWKTRICMGLIY